MSESSQSGEMVTRVFSAWKTAGIACLVLRNHEGLPYFTSNDIDVLVEAAQFLEAERVMLAAASECGFELANRAEFATTACYFYHPISGVQVHFDLFTHLKWRGFEFLFARDVLAGRVSRELFDIPHPAHEAAVNLVASFVFSGRIKDKYRPGIGAVFRAEPAAATAILASTCGGRLASTLVELAGKENWSQAETRIGELRRTLVLRQLVRRPFTTARSLMADAVRLVKRIRRPAGLVVAVCGPAGTGKSTVIPKLVEQLRIIFSPDKGRQIQWRSEVRWGNRPALRPDTHRHQAGNSLTSLTRFVFCWIEFLLAWPLRIWPAQFKGGLVVMDHYYDLLIDPRGCGPRISPTIVCFTGVFLPGPDLVFLLDAPAEVIDPQNQKLPNETAQQRDAFYKLVGGSDRGGKLDASQSPDKLAEDMAKAVLHFLAYRSRKRLGQSERIVQPA